MSAAIEKPIRTATVARIYRLCWFAALAPLGYWLLSWLVPTRVLVDGATLSDTLLWQHLKPTFLSGCSDGCRHIAYGMLAIPVSFVVSFAGAIVSVSLATRQWREYRGLLAQGGAPFGTSLDGLPKPPVSPGLWMLMTAVVLLGYLFVVWLLFGLAGTAANHVRGTAVPSALIGFWITEMMALGQFMAVAVATGICMTILTVSEKMFSLLSRNVVRPTGQDEPGKDR